LVVHQQSKGLHANMPLANMFVAIHPGVELLLGVVEVKGS